MTGEITNCEEAIRMLAEHLDDELAPHLQDRLRQHLDDCRSCCSRAEFEQQLKQQVRQLATEPVPQEVTARVQALLHEFTTAH